MRFLEVHQFEDTAWAKERGEACISPMYAFLRSPLLIVCTYVANTLSVIESYEERKSHWSSTKICR